MGWDDNGLADRAARRRTSSACRCDPSLPYDPDFAPPDRARQGHGRDLAAQLRRALPPAHRRGRAGLRGAVAPARPLGRLVARLRDHRRPQPAPEPARVPAHPRPRRGLLDRGADAVGRRLPHRGRPRPSSRTATSPAPTTASRSRVDGGDLEIETTRPELLAAVRRARRPPRRRALPAAVRHQVAHAALRRRVPVVAHALADPDKGTGIAMVCTFGDITDVVWWRELDLPTREHRAPRSGRDRRDAAARRARRATAWRAIAGRTVKQAQRAIVELLARPARWSATPGRSRTR